MKMFGLTFASSPQLFGGLISFRSVLVRDNMLCQNLPRVGACLRLGKCPSYETASLEELLSWVDANEQDLMNSLEEIQAT